MDINHNYDVGELMDLSDSIHEASGGCDRDSCGRKDRARLDTPFETKYEACEDGTVFFGTPKMLQFAAESGDEEDAISVDLFKIVNCKGVRTSPFGLKRPASSLKSKCSSSKFVTFDTKISDDRQVTCHSPKTPVSAHRSPGNTNRSVVMRSTDPLPAFRLNYSPLCDQTRTPKILQFSDDEGDANSVKLIEMVNCNGVQTSPIGLKSKRPSPKFVTFDEKISKKCQVTCHSPKTPVSSHRSPGMINRSPGMRCVDGSPAFSLLCSPLCDPTRTPKNNNNPSHFWDSGIFTPTPVSSPKLATTSPKHSCLTRIPSRSCMSPLPLIFNSDRDEPSEAASLNEASMPVASNTPPHCHLTSLRLFGKAQTPKDLVERCQRRTFREGIRPRQLKPEMSQCSTEFVNRLGCTASTLTGLKSLDRVCVASGKKLDPKGPQANVNPFVHTSALRSSTKRRRNDMERSEYDGCSPLEDDDISDVPRKKLALREMNTSRYMEEFHEISLIGTGEFGSVYDCVNRLDGCHYAIKKSKAPVAGSIFERNALNEVYAHAVLDKHIHVVRYFTAWAEKGHMYIQNEFCNGGSLASVIDQKRVSGCMFTETELVYILVQTARGLQYIHSEGLVHLDIKPANILIHRERVLLGFSEKDIPDEVECYETDVKTAALCRIYYKIADLGHVTSLSSPRVEEGDCRYLPVEVLQETYKDLTKADVFSLALSIYEAAMLTDLPKNGPEWHSIRECGLPKVPHLSNEFNNLLKAMSSLDSDARPSTAFLIQHPVLIPAHLKTRKELVKELKLEKLKNEMLAQEIAEARRCVKEQELTSSSTTYTSRSTRVVGRNCPRSSSLTYF